MTDTQETQNNEANKNIQENTVQSTENISQQEPVMTEPEGDVHWRKFREQRKAERIQFAEKERELQKKKEEAEALKKAIEAIASPSYPQQTQQSDNFSNYSQPDQNEEKRILEKVNALLDQKEKEREEKRKHQEYAEYPQRLQKNYSDFNHVVSTENLDYLEFHFPELAKPLGMLPDSYEKWESIYKAVKRFIPNLDQEKDMKKMEKNLAKPVAMSRAGMANTTEQAPHIGLSDEQKAKNWERIRKMMKVV